jgi:hypothetical protein
MLRAWPTRPRARPGIRARLAKPSLAPRPVARELALHPRGRVRCPGGGVPRGDVDGGGCHPRLPADEPRLQAPALEPALPAVQRPLLLLAVGSRPVHRALPALRAPVRQPWAGDAAPALPAHLQAEVRLRTAPEGGWSIGPRAQLELRLDGRSWKASVFLQERSRLRPGETATARILVVTPGFDRRGLHAGSSFELWADGRPLARGVVTQLPPAGEASA